MEKVGRVGRGAERRYHEAGAVRKQRARQKGELIDQMVMGENIITIADGAFYADYGLPDMGILYGPFFFDTLGGCLDPAGQRLVCGRM